MEKSYKVLLIGNPNCGKSSIFNVLTGMKAKVGNYAGVSTDKLLGKFSIDNVIINVQDTPGIYTLAAPKAEEKVSRNAVFEGDFDLIINVVDSTKLERNAYLTTQILEMKEPLLLVLNMSDELEKSGISIDTNKLAENLGVDVFSTNANDKSSINLLKIRILDILKDEPKKAKDIWQSIPENILGNSIKSVEDIFAQELGNEYKDCAKWLAIRTFEGDKEILNNIKDRTPKLYEVATKERNLLEYETGQKALNLVSSARYAIIDKIFLSAIQKPQNSSKSNLSDRIDSVLLNKYLALPIMLMFMYLVFLFVFGVGDFFAGIIENGFAYLSDIVSNAFGDSDNALKSLLVNGIIGGVGSVMVFMPNVILLFFAMAIIEESGYMARIAFISDRILRKFGLSGQSAISMILGFGCSVPAILSANALKSKSQRLATMFAIPLIPCSGRLPIFVLLIPVFFSKTFQPIAFIIIYLLAIVLALLLAKLLRIFAYKEESQAFAIELVEYKSIKIYRVLKEMFEQSKSFIIRVSSVVFMASIILWALSYFPQDTSIDKVYNSEIAKLETKKLSDENLKIEKTKLLAKKNYDEFANSFAGKIGEAINPIFKPIGFDSRISSSLLGAWTAKELFISQLAIIFQIDSDDEDGARKNLQKMISQNYSYPQGLSIMIFLLLGLPCMTTVATTLIQTKSIKTALSQLFVATFIAYTAAFVVYRIAIFL